MILLIDIGNTRIKWARIENGLLSAQSAIAHTGLTPAQLHDALIAGAPRPRRVLASNVAGQRVGELVAAALTSGWGLEPEFVQATASAGGVRNGYRDPSQLGVDRWLAMIGARSLESGAVCVASVGTATTIDALDASGRHHGGLIAPGPDLMMSALYRSTSDIAARAANGGRSDAFFADNTRGAVEQGSVHAVAALIDRAVDEFASRQGERPALILTGGSSSDVAAALNTPHRIVHNLVLRGLAVLTG